MTATQSTTETLVPASVRSDQAKLVYLYIDRVGWATPEAIAEALSLSKLGVLGVLGTLRDRGVVRQRDGRYRVA